MNILFIAAQYNPFSKEKGGSSQRSHLFAEALAQLGHVDVMVTESNVISDIANCTVCYSQNINMWYSGFGNRKAKLKRLLHCNNPYAIFPIITQAAEVIETLLQKKQYDIICTRYLETAIMCDLLKYSNRLVVDVDDYPPHDMIKLAKMSHSFRARVYYSILGLAMDNCMRQIIKGLKYVFYPNDFHYYATNASWLPNIPFYDVRRLDTCINENTLLFVGGLSYLPNYLGVQHFVEVIFPLIKKKIPDVSLNIVGKYKENEWFEKVRGIEGIHFHGFVDSIYEVYEDSAISIMPIYSGAGTNIKVIESLSMGRTCVMTTIAERGYDKFFESGVDYFVAKNDRQFVDYIVLLLSDRKLRMQMEQSCSKKAEQYFSKQCFLKIVRDALNQNYE